MNKTLLVTMYAIISTFTIALFGFVWCLLLWPAWNATMPHLFGLPEITYWQSWLLYVLVSSYWKIVVMPVELWKKKNFGVGD